MVEQLPLKQLVEGSNPSGRTTKHLIFGWDFLLAKKRRPGSGLEGPIRVLKFVEPLVPLNGQSLR
jgi:hypothetical protein